MNKSETSDQPVDSTEQINKNGKFIRYGTSFYLVLDF